MTKTKLKLIILIAYKGFKKKGKKEKKKEYRVKRYNVFAVAVIVVVVVIPFQGSSTLKCVNTYSIYIFKMRITLRQVGCFKILHFCVS